LKAGIVWLTFAVTTLTGSYVWKVSNAVVAAWAAASEMRVTFWMAHTIVDVTGMAKPIYVTCALLGQFAVSGMSDTL